MPYKKQKAIRSNNNKCHLRPNDRFGFNIVNMKTRQSIFLFLMLLSTVAGAQTITRRAYPTPKVTPEVRHIRSMMKPIRVDASGVTLPLAVDNSKNKFFPPIINQDGGSCAQASSIGYVFTYEINRLLDRNASASADNRFAYKFSWNMLNDGEDQGGFAEQGFYLAQRYGMMTESDYGNSGLYQFRWATGYDKYLRAMHYRVKEILQFNAADIAALKRWLYDAADGSATGGLLTFSSQSSGWTINDHYDGPSKTGYHSLLTQLATTGAHAMTIVGYDDLVEFNDPDGKMHKGAFIVCNSWGTFSHDKGRFYLPYWFFTDHQHTDLSLSSQMQAVRVTTYEPKAVFKVKIKYNSRNDLSFGTAFRTDGNTTSTPQYSYAQAFFNAGGDHPMQGQYLGNEIEIAIDASNGVTAASADGDVFFLAVKKAAIGKTVGDGTVEAVSLVDYRGAEPVEYKCVSSALPTAVKPGVTAFYVQPSDNRKSNYTVSASPYKYVENGTVSSRTFVIRTADGKTKKIKFGNMSPDGQSLDIRYE